MFHFQAEENKKVIYIVLSENGKNCYDIFIAQKIEIANKILSDVMEQQQDEFIQFISKFGQILLPEQ